MISPRCISCGCTETTACMVVLFGQLQGCAWILVDRRRGEGLCSACATLPQLVYGVLSHARNGITVRELADGVGKTPAQIRRVLGRLQSHGLADVDGQRVDGSYVWRRTEAST